MTEPYQVVDMTLAGDRAVNEAKSPSRGTHCVGAGKGEKRDTDKKQNNLSKTNNLLDSSTSYG